MLARRNCVSQAEILCHIMVGASVAYPGQDLVVLEQQTSGRARSKDDRQFVEEKVHGGEVAVTIG